MLTGRNLVPVPLRKRAWGTFPFPPHYEMKFLVHVPYINWHGKYFRSRTVYLFIIRKLREYMENIPLYFPIIPLNFPLNHMDENHKHMSRQQAWRAKSVPRKEEERGTWHFRSSRKLSTNCQVESADGESLISYHVWRWPIDTSRVTPPEWTNLPSSPTREEQVSQ